MIRHTKKRHPQSEISNTSYLKVCFFHSPTKIFSSCKQNHITSKGRPTYRNDTKIYIQIYYDLRSKNKNTSLEHSKLHIISRDFSGNKKRTTDLEMKQGGRGEREVTQNKEELHESIGSSGG